MKRKFFQLLFSRIVTEKFEKSDKFKVVGFQLQKDISTLFGRSLAIREIDAGSDNAAEIELNNLTTPYYDIERFGITFVASPRHADVLIITGAITHNMELAARKTYDAMPAPKFVVAVGDDACGEGIFQGTYAVSGGAGSLFKVDLKIPGNPPSPLEIIQGLLALMAEIRRERGNGKNKIIK